MICARRKDDKAFYIDFEGKTDMVKLITWLARHGVWFIFESNEEGNYGIVVTRNYPDKVQELLDDEAYWS